jgi:hypothetical protein
LVVRFTLEHTANDQGHREFARDETVVDISLTVPDCLLLDPNDLMQRLAVRSDDCVNGRARLESFPSNWESPCNGAERHPKLQDAA